MEGTELITPTKYGHGREEYARFLGEAKTVASVTGGEAFVWNRVNRDLPSAVV